MDCLIECSQKEQTFNWKKTVFKFVVGQIDLKHDYFL